MNTKVAIIGAGTAGLSTAIFLSRLNYQCDLYEEVASPQAVGAGLLLQPQGLQILDELQLLPEILTKGSCVKRLYGENKKSSIIMDFKYAELHAGLFGIGIHRGSLFESLFCAAKPCVNQLYLNQKVIHLSQNKNNVVVRTNASMEKTYDLVVIANGTWSTLTKQLNLSVKNNTYPWGALWAIFDNSPHFSVNALTQKYHKCHTMAGFLPSGVNPITHKQCISFFWSLKADQLCQWKQTDIQDWKQKVIDFWPESYIFIDSIKSHKDLTFASYADNRMKQWHDSKIVVLGDAAHAMSPQLGQGANMALVDAWQLYESLKQNHSIESSLSHYSSSRKKHLEFYQMASRFLTPFFQSNSQFAALFRDLTFPPMRYIPFAKKQALTTLFGMKQSLFHNKFSLDLDKLSKKLNPIK